MEREVVSDISLHALFTGTLINKVCQQVGLHNFLSSDAQHEKQSFWQSKSLTNKYYPLMETKNGQWFALG